MTENFQNISQLVTYARKSNNRIFFAFLETPDDDTPMKVWVKKAVTSKSKNWHALQSLFAKLMPFPMIRPTVSAGGSKAMAQEAQRLEIFAEAGICVPTVLFYENDILITADCGDSLHNRLQNETGASERFLLIEKAAQTLLSLHGKGLCHGRPYVKDMTYSNQNIGFLDFEENPLSVMPLEDAQARDLWLFALSVALFTDEEGLIRIAHTLVQNSKKETTKALFRFVRFLKPLRMLISFLRIPGKDVQKALKANLAFEKNML